MEPRKRRYRARVGARVVAAAAVARAGPHPGRAGLVRRRPHRPRRAAPSTWRPRCVREHSPTTAVLDASVGATDSMDQAEQALAIARELDDPALLARALTACGFIAGSFNPEVARPYFAEAIGLARALGDRWRLSQILGWQALGGAIAGDPIAARAAAEEGRDLADAIGDRFTSRFCRWCLGLAQMMQGDLAGAIAQIRRGGRRGRGGSRRALVGRLPRTAWAHALAYQGDTSAARAAADAAVEAAAELGGFVRGHRLQALAVAALAAGDVAAAQEAARRPGGSMSVRPEVRVSAMSPHGRGRPGTRRSGRGQTLGRRGRLGDAGWHLVMALRTRARVAIAQGEPNRPNATPTTRSRSPPTSRHIRAFPTPSSASPI